MASAARSPGAERQRRRRSRDRRGVRVFHVEAVDNAVAEALIRAGRLSPDAAARHSEVERELGVVIAQFVASWNV
jgi:hypothetical protein